MMMLHTRADRKYETHTVHWRLCACAWPKKRSHDVKFPDHGGRCGRVYCVSTQLPVRVCVCEWVTSSLTPSSCQVSFSAPLSCHTHSPFLKATRERQRRRKKKEALGHMWGQTHRVARRLFLSCPPLSHWHAYALCYDVNKDLYGRYFEICTAKHFQPWGLMLLFFV